MSSVGGDAESAAGEGTVQRTQQAQVPPPCKRWTATQINPCWGIVAQPVCSDTDPDHASWTEGQKHNYNKWLYSSTADDACRKFAYAYGKYGLPTPKNLLPSKAELEPIPGPGGTTNWRAKCFGTNYDVDPPVLTQITNYVYQESVTPEPCCSRTPAGPYSGLTPSGTTEAGRHFSTTLKNAIKTQNQTTFGTTGNVVSSNLGMFDDANTLAWSKRGITAPVSAATVDDDTEFDPTAPPPPPESVPYLANVDHIVPRIDTHGCRCGENSPANALVISAPLNQRMSNRCTADPNDPNDPGHMRQLILDNYTTP